MLHDSERVQKVKARLLEMERKSWEQGVAAQALLELGDWEALSPLVLEAVARQTPDGRLGVAREHDGSATDPAANGEPLLRFAEREGDRDLGAAAARMLAFLKTTAKRDEHGVIYHLLDLPEIWIDSAYMAPPFLAAMGEIEDALVQIEGYRRRLWDPAARLFAHQWDDRRATLKRAAHWGVGNGWAAAGLVRVLAVLEREGHPRRVQLIEYLRDLIDGCLAHLRPDGLFYDVIDDPGTFVETNLAQMLAYSIYRSVAGGWLDPALRIAADRMRAAALQRVDAAGWVQGVCGAPTFDRPGTAAEGQAFHLLMEAAAHDLEVATPSAH